MVRARDAVKDAARVYYQVRFRLSVGYIEHVNDSIVHGNELTEDC